MESITYTKNYICEKNFYVKYNNEDSTFELEFKDCEYLDKW